jgi:hypothetical protein
MKTMHHKIWPAMLIAALMLVTGSPLALAQHTSNSYLIDEYFFGPGGTLDSTSDSYTIRASVGDIGVGNTLGTLFQLYSGYTTTDVPYLEMVVTPATINLGLMSVSAPATGEATFYVRTYLASGYAVTTFPDPPVNGNYHIANLATPTASSPGTEQFGINLVANTQPVEFGADPVQQPDENFGFGSAAANYDDPNLFTYNNGDTIAGSDSSSGTTVYTISYMMNVGELTPGGVYTMDHTLIATSTF